MERRTATFLPKRGHACVVPKWFVPIQCFEGHPYTPTMDRVAAGQCCPLLYSTFDPRGAKHPGLVVNGQFRLESIDRRDRVDSDHDNATLA